MSITVISINDNILAQFTLITGIMNHVIIIGSNNSFPCCSFDGVVAKLEL